MHGLGSALVSEATADRVSSWDRQHLAGLWAHKHAVDDVPVWRSKKAGKMPAVPERNPVQRVSLRSVGTTPRMRGQDTYFPEAPSVQTANGRDGEIRILSPNSNKKPGSSSERRAQESVVTKSVRHLIKRRHEKGGVYTNVSHFRLASP
jgi:hypothetical protein